MLRTICKQFSRPIATLNLSSLKYQCSNRRLYCSNENRNDYGGLSVNDTEVLKYLTNAKTEYTDLVNRKESLGRDGHEKIKELQQMVEIYESRNAAIENLKILEEEMCKEQDVDLLAMMKEEKQVLLLMNVWSHPSGRFCNESFPSKGIFSIRGIIEQPTHGINFRYARMSFLFVIISGGYSWCGWPRSNVICKRNI